MEYNFEKLEVWQLSLELSDMVYKMTDLLPAKEKFNISNQMIRATTSISLNIAEGSINISNREKRRYLRISLHSLVEVIACLRLIERRKYIEIEKFTGLENIINKLFAKLNAFIKVL